MKIIYFNDESEAEAFFYGVSWFSIHPSSIDPDSLCVKVGKTDTENNTDQTIAYSNGVITFMNNSGIIEKGARVKMINMGGNDPDPIPFGSEGTVDKAVFNGICMTVDVIWDIKRSLSVTLSQDQIEVSPPTAL